MKPFRLLPFLAVLLLPAFLRAANVDVSNRIVTDPGTVVKAHHASSAATVDLSPKTGSFTDYNVNDLLVFGVDHHYFLQFDSSMHVRIKVHVQPYDVANAPMTAFHKYLEINYSPYSPAQTFTDQDAYHFAGAYAFDFEIDSIYINNVRHDTLPANLYLEGDIHLERYFDFTSNAVTPISMGDPTVSDRDCDGKNDEINISWALTAGAEEYQLEWTFVNDYGKTTAVFLPDDSVSFDFRNNATRITTTNTSYTIPLIFDHGYILFRVRGIGRSMTDPTQIITGVWSDVDADIVQNGLTQYHITSPHEADLNWQVTTTFAEEGKKKEVISYFDGSLRNRQTVTRINSDENVVVGETMYDHQGRPAVNVLPVPVDTPSCMSGHHTAAIRYYPNFNRNDAGDEYSMNDFDVDGAGGSCAIDTVGMDAAHGASHYYSPQNPQLGAQQGLVPDGLRFPFTRVEYTPDNTGRIRRQGGVGPQFQVGTGKETKYFYAAPNQLQLDRLFGSEVGDAAHYKKNMVVDPNGQVSVSYLDAEGRVIATALAGNPPTNTVALPNDSTEADTLTVDLFAKDANGYSQLNAPNIHEGVIGFNSQLAVSSAGYYSFSYDLEIDTLYDACLAANMCFSCVYNLDIRVTDECGTNLALPGNQTIHKHVGHFRESLDHDSLFFSSVCHGMSDTTELDTFRIYLPVGTYTVSKLLEVNKDAQDFYVAAYLDSSINTCAKTLNDFQEEFLAQVDTSDCYIDCHTCAAALGDRDSYVAEGKGTAYDYDIQMEKCNNMCRTITPCEASYDMMLLDVSPGGQYAEFIDNDSAIVRPEQYPLSVLNTGNVMPYRMQHGSGGDWHDPHALVNGTNYAYYIDEDGSRSHISITPDGGSNYLPVVVNTGVGYVFQDADGNYYTYPENLLHVSDFISAWRPSWARSLVQFHPEYCYYQTCSAYSQVPTAADSTTSDTFDNLLRTTNTFQDAVTAGLIKPTYLSVPIPTHRLTNWFTATTVHPYDPFTTATGTYGSFSTALSNKFNNYLVTGFGTYTMVEAAAMAVRCGLNYNVLPTGTCVEFGYDYVVGNPAINDSIRDLEWNMLKSFYLSAKQDLQNQRADSIALHGCNTLNDCIGEGQDFDPSAAGMVNFASLTFGASEYFNSGEPCSVGLFMYYARKQKRFPDPHEIPQISPQDAAYQVYLQTGQCPMARSLQELFTDLAIHDSLDDAGLYLPGIAAYNSFYMAKYNFAPSAPITTEAWLWKASTSSGLLNIAWVDTTGGGNDTICNLQLDKTLTSISNWDDILAFRDLTATGTDINGNYTFTALAVLPGTGSHVYDYQEVTGYISCINIGYCLFPKTCKANSYARDLQLLMTALAVNGDLLGTNINLETSTYLPFLTPRIRQQLGTPNSALRWTYNSGLPGFILKDNTSATNQLIFPIHVMTPGTAVLSNVRSFINVVGGENYTFDLDGRDSDDSLIVHLHMTTLHKMGGDTIGFSMGDCDFPTPLACNQRENFVSRDFERLLNEKLSEKVFTGNIDLFQSLHMTDLLQSYLPEIDSTTTSTYLDTVISGVHYDTLAFSINGCTLQLHHRDDNSPARSLDSLLSVSNLTGIGTTDAEGNYHNFYLLANYSVNGDPYTDTLFGTSCWPLKNCCSSCPDTTVYQQQQMLLMSQQQQQQPQSLDLDSLYLVMGRMIPDSSLAWYGVYTNAIQGVNNRNNWQPQSNNYVVPISYTDYTRLGIPMAQEAYIAFIDHFNSAFDNHGYLDDPELFIREHGPGTNAGMQYVRYTAAVAAYNQRAQSQNVAALTVMTDTAFYHNRLADSVFLYIDYLETRPGANNQPAQSAMTWLGQRNSLFASGDSCSIMYDHYVTSWMGYHHQQQLNTTCPRYATVSALFSYDDFIANNLCNTQGYAMIAQYNSEMVNNDCVGGLPFEEPSYGAYRSYSLLMDEDEPCEELYLDFVAALDSFNHTAYAAHYSFYLDTTIYYNFAAFDRAGLCSCVSSYLDYLNQYLDNPSNFSPPLPYDIDHFPGCATGIFTANDPCKDSYAHYLDAAIKYNQFVYDHPGSGFDSLLVQYDYSQFVADSLCYCVEEFVAHVDAIVDGLWNNDPDSAFTLLRFGEYCHRGPPCTPQTTPLDTFISPPSTYDNPCVQYKINMALANAQLAYQQYVDSMTTAIADRYRTHCLQAAENFTTRYKDKEYHYTLYYYDQAGNLIKTVPPEGIVPLDIDSSSDELELAIKDDRAHNTHTVFTQHRMATLYEYNSLNQLVRQSMPDQDNVNIWETTLPNGLDSRLKISRTQFVSATRGYLSGFITGTIDRGYVYVTDDGGHTWKRYGGEVGAGINKIQWLNSSQAYAVGDAGTVLKSSDGGASWDMLNTWVTTITSSDLRYNLNDLYFTSSTDGYMAGDHALLLHTTNGGTSFTQIDLSSHGVGSSDDITGITYDGSNYYFSIRRDGGTDPDEGHILVYDGSSTWTMQTSLRTAAALRKVQYYGVDSAYAAGDDGTLLHTADNGDNWTVVATATASKFIDVYFRNVNEGIALIENGSGQGELWKTFDAGRTWTMLGQPGDDYKGLYAYEENSGGAKVVAVGSAGRVSRVIMQAGTGYGIIDLNVPSTGHTLKCAWATTVGAQLWLYVAGTGDTIFRTADATASYITWNGIYDGLTGADTNIVRMDAMKMTASANPAISGTLVTATGKLFSLFKANNASTHTVTAFTTPTPASNNFVDVANTTGNYQVTFNKTDQKLYTILLSSGSGTLTASTMSPSVAPYSTVSSITQDGSGNALLVTTGGELLYSAFSPVGPSAIYRDSTTHLTGLPLRCIEFSGSGGDVYTAGDDGNIIEQSSAGNWRILPAGTAEKINAIDLNSTSTGLAAGNNGLLLDMTIGGSSITTTTVTTSTTADLYDITRSGNAVYVAGAAGTLLSSGNITGGSVSQSIFTTSQALNGVAFRPSSSTAMAVGEQAHFRWCIGQSAMVNKQVFTTTLRGIHFVDASHGYVVGDRFTARKTSDGGLTWQVVLPQSATTGSALPNLNAVYSLSGGTAMVTGTQRYVGQVSGTNATQCSSTTALSTGYTFNAIDFASPTEGFIVGKLSTSGVFLSTTDGGATWAVNAATIGSTSLRAVKAFKRSGQVSFITAGTNTTLQYWDGSSFSGTACALPTITGGCTFNDIYFHDDVAGYVVGTNGIVLRSANFAFSSSTGLYTAGSWVREWTNDSLRAQVDTTKMSIASVAFATRHDGFLGGGFDNTLYPSAWIGYARNVHDESDEFSTRFWYDRLGRIVLSQNSRQYAEAPRRYSYSTYDVLGRVIEAGEKRENQWGDPQQTSVFGAYVNNFFNPVVINDDSLNTWLGTGSGLRTEVTHTYYDTTRVRISLRLPADFVQENLRKRVVCTTYEDTLDGVDSTYNYATHYSYDIHGNVKDLLQDNPKVFALGQDFKRVHYDYDLISGKVNSVDYQKDTSRDQFHHQYEYDADNRITHVATSSDNVLWDHDAHYQYYSHGPLARTELGEWNVQGMDYAYTLQGWIKGVNSNTLDTTRDMGHDADTTNTNPNRWFAKDVMGYSLTYFEGDYKPIDYANKWTPVTKRFEADQSGSDLIAARSDFFNGNISAMVTTITNPSTHEVLPQGMAYQYDQLNRLKSAQGYVNIQPSSNAWRVNSANGRMYANSFDYDANGNILRQLRRDSSEKIIDSLLYRYERDAYGKMLRNRLYNVQDTVASIRYPDDIDDQGTFTAAHASINSANNYSYDAEGRLIRDAQEEIDTIKWTVTGKIKAIIRDALSTKKNLKFDYDPMGNRIAKHVYDASWNWEKSTFYVRDAQGNVMATYDQTESMSLMSYKVKERDIYGSSRLGMYAEEAELLGTGAYDTSNFSHVSGDRQYELSNHLGNVLAVVTDKVLPKDWDSDDTTDNYWVELLSASDYYPFGAPMKGRSFQSASYRYGFNGKENDPEANGTGNGTQDYGMRTYNPQLGRFFSIDPLTKKYPTLAPYQFASNTPMQAIDADGLEATKVTSTNPQPAPGSQLNPTDVTQPPINGGAEEPQTGLNVTQNAGTPSVSAAAGVSAGGVVVPGNPGVLTPPAGAAAASAAAIFNHLARVTEYVKSNPDLFPGGSFQWGWFFATAIPGAISNGNSNGNGWGGAGAPQNGTLVSGGTFGINIPINSYTWTAAPGNPPLPGGIVAANTWFSADNASLQALVPPAAPAGFPNAGMAIEILDFTNVAPPAPALLAARPAGAPAVLAGPVAPAGALSLGLETVNGNANANFISGSVADMGILFSKYYNRGAMLGRALGGNASRLTLSGGLGGQMLFSNSNGSVWPYYPGIGSGEKQ